MGYLLPALTEAKFSNQRDVVLGRAPQQNYRRPAVNPPADGRCWRRCFRPIIRITGRRSATSPTCRRCVSTKCARSSAAITIRRMPRSRSRATSIAAGALALVDQYFGEIEAGERVEPVRVSAELPGQVRILFEDRVELPRLYLAWLTPAMFAEGDADLDLAADLLANGKTSRLYRRLVFDERLATDVSASQNSREMAGYAQITATAAPGHTLGELEHAILEEIARLAAEGPTDEEIERGRVQAETQFMFRLQTVGGFGGKSDQLNAYNVFLNDPAFFDRDLARYQVVTHASLQQAAARYLDPRGRVTLSIVPQGRTALAAPDSAPAVVS